MLYPEWRCPEPTIDPPEPPMPRCPVCGEYFEEIFLGNWDEVLGCDHCVRTLSVWDWESEPYEQ